MHKLLLCIALLCSLQVSAQSHKPSAKSKSHPQSSVHKKAAPSPLTVALVEMKEAFKEKMAEHNDYVTAFVIQAFRPKAQYMYEVEEMLDKVPTDQESRDMFLIALARRSGREEMIIEQLHALGISTASARLIAAYTIKLDY